MSNEQGQAVKSTKNNSAKPGHIASAAKKPSGNSAEDQKRRAQFAARGVDRAAKKAADDAEAAAEARRQLYASKRVRKGKTAKDRAKNAKAKNLENKYSRASWQQDTKGGAFPVSTCNGKRNRYCVTGKGGETVYLKATATSGRR